jgi:putative sigma-54 modulation protein
VRTIVKGRNVEVPERVRDYAERKLAHIARVVDERTDAIIELSNEHHRSPDDAHIAEVTLVINGRTLHSHAAGSSYQAAIDTVVDKVERQAVDHKERPRVHARPSEEKILLRRIADGTAEGTPERGIVKVKRFAIEPMFEEDAIAAMEELGHRFFVFVNAENERVAVLYGRDDGQYGLIEPVVGGGYSMGGGHSMGDGDTKGDAPDKGTTHEDAKGGTRGRAKGGRHAKGGRSNGRH